MNKFFSTISCVFIFLCSFLFAEDVFENKIIGDVRIIIENSIDSSYNTNALTKRLITQKGALFSQNTFDSDIKKLAEDFDKIEPNFDLKEDNKLYITIKIWLRPTIVKINWHGNELVKTKKLQKEMELKIPAVFNKITFNTALDKVKEFYIKKGFFESQVTYKENYLPKNEVIIDIYVKEGKSGKVQEIKFEGFTKNERSDLLKEIVTKKYNFVLSWLTGAGIFREDVLEQDKMNIINYLQNKGYADAKVDIKILEDKVTKKIIIEISAHRGILYRFGKVTFDGNCLLTKDEILSKILIHPDEPFSPEKIRQTSQAIKDVYGEKGYIEANVYYDTQLMENEPMYNVSFYIDEGECYKIGYIKIFGNKSTKSRIILREALLVPGEKFDTRKLKSTQRHLENLGFFKTVNVYALQSSDPNLGPNYRDINIEVEEASTGHLSFAAGFSSSDSISGTVDVTENNFDHTGLTKMFKYGSSALRGGGEYLQLKGTYGKKQQNFSLTWMDPRFKDSLWRTGFEFSGTQSSLQSKNYDIKTLGGSLFASYPFSNFWSYGMKYRLRGTDNKIKHSKQGDNESLEKYTKRKQDIINESRENNEGLISAYGNFLSYDSTDNSYKPHQGLRAMLDLEYVGLGGSYRFLKMAYTNAYYYPIWCKGVLKYRFDLKFINRFGHLHRPLAADKVPLSERYFLGGDTTVRGYKPYILGPTLKKNNEPSGGISSMLLSIEYNQEIIKPLMDVFFFVDAGSISARKYSIKTPNASVGLGLRLEIMNRVPMTVGWGYPINPRRHDDRQSLFFHMGGQF
ncbi:MAG: outer membrane protein assembly factor BamA [Parachlamydiales bacterium]|jgi:outer membrane protein insertion porin family